MPSHTLTASSLSCPGEMRQRLRWADGKLVKEAIDEQLEALLGPRGPDTPQEKQEKVQDMQSREEHRRVCFSRKHCLCCLKQKSGGAKSVSVAKERKEEKHEGGGGEVESEKTAGELLGEAANFHKPGTTLQQ